MQLTTCPKCGGTTTLLQIKKDIEEVPDLSRRMETIRIPVKVEEFRCQELRCEHEFEKIFREPTM